MDIVQQMEQMSAFLRDFSVTLYAYYEDLKKQGFTDEQAFALTRDYQNSTIAGNK